MKNEKGVRNLRKMKRILRFTIYSSYNKKSSILENLKN